MLECGPARVARFRSEGIVFSANGRRQWPLFTGCWQNGQPRQLENRAAAEVPELPNAVIAREHLTLLSFSSVLREGMFSGRIESSLSSKTDGPSAAGDDHRPVSFLIRQVAFRLENPGDK
jgi:hypothetical protein